MIKLKCKKCGQITAYINHDEKLVGPNYCRDCYEDLGITLKSKIKDKK